MMVNPPVTDDSSAVRGGGSVSGEIMLFGVRVKVDHMRKSVSMNNLSQYEHAQDLSNNVDISAAATNAVAAGYTSADDAAGHHQSNASRERKRGVPWTEEEHKRFLLGLERVGKGDWRGISKNFVKTRTPTQVASHAQKYFLRKNNLNRRRRRSSLFDITTDSVNTVQVGEQLPKLDNLIGHAMQSPEIPNMVGFPAPPIPVSVGSSTRNLSESLTYGNADQLNVVSPALFCPLTTLPMTNHLPTRAEVSPSQNLTTQDSSLSLNLSLSFDHQNHLSIRHSSPPVMPSFSNGDGMISVV